MIAALMEPVVGLQRLRALVLKGMGPERWRGKHCLRLLTESLSVWTSMVRYTNYDDCGARAAGVQLKWSLLKGDGELHLPSGFLWCSLRKAKVSGRLQWTRNVSLHETICIKDEQIASDGSNVHVWRHDIFLGW